MLRRIMNPIVQPAAAHTPRAWLTLAVLCLVYLMNFLDRTLIYILFTPIKAELSLSDLELALLGSTSFVLFYSVLGVPFGRLADRVSRRGLIAVGLVTWSVFSGLSGFADSFWTLFFCRVMVGVGEATLGPAALSWLSDIFPAERRATVQSLYSAGIPLGAAAAFFGGGLIAAEWSWRHAFWILGFPGVLLALTVWMLPEPGRRVSSTSAPAADWRGLLRSSALRWHVLGYAAFAVATNSLSIWVPSLLVRAHGLSLAQIGTLSGVSMAIAGGAGTAFGGWIADRVRARMGGGRLLFGAVLAGLCVPVWAGLLSFNQPELLFVCYFLLAGLGLAWLGPAAADVHELVRPELRGLGIAVYFFVVNGLGYGLAPPLVGRFSDALGGDPGAMRAALWSAPLACAVAAVLLWVASRKMVLEQGSEDLDVPAARAAS